MIYRHKHNKGFYLIGLLIALMIIMILTGKFMTGDEKSGTEGAIHSLDKSKAAACSANRMSLQTQLQMWSISHPGEEITLEKLRAANYSIPKCPAGGEYSISKQGYIHCSIHDPDPSATTPTPAGN